MRLVPAVKLPRTQLSLAGFLLPEGNVLYLTLRPELHLLKELTSGLPTGRTYFYTNTYNTSIETLHKDFRIENT